MGQANCSRWTWRHTSCTRAAVEFGPVVGPVDKPSLCGLRRARSPPSSYGAGVCAQALYFTQMFRLQGRSYMYMRCVAYGCSFTNHFSSCFSLDIPSRVQIEGGEWRDSMFLGVRVPASPPFVRIASVAFLGRAVRPLCSRSSGKSFPGYNRDPQNHRAAHPQLRGRGQRQHACAHGQDSVDRVPERVLLLQH